MACAGSVPAGLTFGYDAVGDLTSYCDVGGTTNYGYDVVNRVTGLAEPGGSLTSSGTCATNPCTGFSYDNDDRRTQASFPGGATLNLAYDGAGNQTSAIGKDSSSNVLTSFSYTYNGGTNDRALRQTMSEADAVATRMTTYSYDAFNRLTDATPNDASPTYHYRYDANGNGCRTDTSACQGAADPYQYNAANELTASPGVSSWSYDGNGNVTGNPAGALPQLQRQEPDHGDDLWRHDALRPDVCRCRPDRAHGGRLYQLCRQPAGRDDRQERRQLDVLPARQRWEPDWGADARRQPLVLPGRRSRVDGRGDQ